MVAYFVPLQSHTYDITPFPYFLHLEGKRNGRDLPRGKNRVSVALLGALGGGIPTCSVAVLGRPRKSKRTNKHMSPSIVCSPLSGFDLQLCLALAFRVVNYFTSNLLESFLFFPPPKRCLPCALCTQFISPLTLASPLVPGPSFQEISYGLQSLVFRVESDLKPISSPCVACKWCTMRPFSPTVWGQISQPYAGRLTSADDLISYRFSHRSVSLWRVMLLMKSISSSVNLSAVSFPVIPSCLRIRISSVSPLGVCMVSRVRYTCRRRA